MVEKIMTTTKQMVRQKAIGKVAMTTFEKVTAFFLFFIVVVLMFVTIHTRSTVDVIQQEVENVRYETQEIVDDNTVLNQKIDSLMTADRLKDIATKYGLSRNESNVRSIVR